MTLGAQPFVQGMNYLLAGPAGHVGVIIANGIEGGLDEHERLRSHDGVALLEDGLGARSAPR